MRPTGMTASRTVGRATRRPLRVEMIVPDLVGGGMEVMVAGLTRALAERGHDVGVTCFFGRGEIAEALADAGHRVAVVPAPGLGTNWRAPALIAHFAALAPDVVHVHSGVWPKAARAARAAGVPMVGHTAHGLLDRERWIDRALKRWAARHTDWVAAVSAPLADYFVRDAGVPERQVRVVLNGVDTRRFVPGVRSGALRARLGLGERPLVGNVARLAPVKNHTLLLSAFARLRTQLPDAALVLVGEGPSRAEIERHAAALRLEGSVFLVGATSDVAPVYRDLDLFVLSSISEGTSISILEAMASGVPVIATDVGGNGELLDRGRCGTLVPSADEQALSEAMRRVLLEPAEPAALVEAARRRVLERFSEDAMVDAYEDLYFGARRVARAPAERREAEEMQSCAE